MSYFAPYIDSAGVHLPTYEDRLAQLLDDYRRIFGAIPRAFNAGTASVSGSGYLNILVRRSRLSGVA